MTMTMTRAVIRPAGLLAAVKQCRSDECASQIVEFALSLPVLVLFVVGIFDFSGAISLKQKLTNAAREGARVAASDPANDLAAPLSSGIPASVADAFYVVDNYLLSEKINDCGLQAATPVQTANSLTWVSTAAGCGAGPALVLTINRGCVTKPTINGAVVDAVSTCVTLQYPYKWQYNNVAGLFGGSFTGPTSMTTTSTAFNEN
jgi:Flp pilus assembly protein TadG